MLPGPGWNNMRNPSLSWNAPSPSQQHYQPELSSTMRRSKSMRAVLEFKDKASIDWCAEAWALNPFDNRPCLFEKSKAPRNVTRFSLLPCEGANRSSLVTFPSITTTLIMYESPQHSSNRVSPTLRQGRENQSHGVQVSPLQSWGSWLHLSCNSGRFSLPYRNQNAATLMHKGVLSIKLLN